MKKTTEDFRDLYETEQEQNDAASNAEKDSIIESQRSFIRVLWVALIFSTLLMGHNAFKMAKMAYEVKMLTEQYEDPSYQGNANIGGMNYNLYYQDNSDIGDDMAVDLGNSESETVEWSQYVNQ